MRISKIGLSACLVALLAGIGASPALGAPAFQVELTNDPTTLPRQDEKMVYTASVKNTAGATSEVGDVLTCNHGAPLGNPTPTVSYQWLRNAEEIPGATAKTYTVAEADKGKSLQCKVTATNDADGLGSTYAPISVSRVSLPPVVVEPSPTPAPPSGAAEPGARIEGGLLALSTGTATTTAGSNLLTEVISTKGTGTLTAGSKTVTGVSTESGEFAGGNAGTQIITGTGIATATATGTFDKKNSEGAKTNQGLIVPLTSPSGTFAVGQRLAGTGTKTDGKTITDVGPGYIEIGSAPPTSFAEGTYSFTAHTFITGVGPGTLELATAATASGSQALAAGVTPFSPGQAISGEGIPPGTTITGGLGFGGGGDIKGDRELVMSNNATATKAGAVISAVPTATCKAPDGWSGDGITWSFRWLRNDEPIPGATGPTYTLTKADTEPPSMLQCEATAEDASGNRAVTIASRETRPKWPPPYFSSASGVSPTVAVPNSTSGPVTLEVELPSGLETFLYQQQGGLGWKCTSQVATPSSNARVTCTRNDALNPGESYPNLSLAVNLGKDAPEVGTAIATVSGGGAPTPATDSATYTFTPGDTFGILPGSFEAGVFDEAGNPHTKAGGHPYRGYTTFQFATRVAGDGDLWPIEDIKDVAVDTPRGFVGNAKASPALCDSIDDMLAGLCPSGSSVGGVDVFTNIGNAIDQPLFSFEPEFGTPAQFAFLVGSQFPYTFVPELRPEEGYAISFRTAPIIRNPKIKGSNVDLCNFGAKIKARLFEVCRKATEAGANPIPLFTNPTRCSGPPPTARLRIDSWQNPEEIKTYDFTTPQITECEAVEFEPEAELTPTNRQADSPTGLEVEFEMSTDGLLTSTGVSEANLDNVTVRFPKGMTINSAAAEGLGACTLAQVQMKTNLPDKCPESSKVGVIEIDTPLIRETLTGSIFVAAQNDNPFNETLGLYMVFASARDGVIIKIAGKLETDPNTGQLVSTFVENPEAPFSRLALQFNSGPRAPLINPPKCGTYAIRAEFSPWSALNPANPTPDEIVIDDSTYKVNRGPNNGACPTGDLEPKLDAGLLNTQAGSKSPFLLELSRPDGSQRFTGVEVANPKGLTAYLKGVSICPESSLASISPAEQTGASQLANPSCPANSLVGTAQAGSGSGPLPFYVETGKVYLAGPYKGAPVSLAIVTPALAGPYDLGSVLVRTPLYVDPVSAQVRAVSDPIPLALHGLSLNVRDIRVALNRPNFTAAPTNCEPSSVEALVKGAEGATATVSNHFQAGGCEALGFKPKLSFRLFGGTKRGAHPKFRALLKARPGDANVAAASVALPRSEFLDQAHIRTVCTRVQFAADACPKGSIYGEASATTPLLDSPVSGPVYLRSSSHELPDLVVALRGPDTQPIEVELVGRVDSVNGGIRSSFEVVPDQPVSSFTLTMQGGKKGLLVNSRDLCKGKPQKATAEFIAQNGREISLRPEMKNACKSSARKGKKSKGKKRR